MSLWVQHNMEHHVRQALEAVHLVNPDGHHFGRPFVSSYQLALAIDEVAPELRVALGKEIGGVGTGAHDSLAQYIGRELSRQIDDQGAEHYAEGAFMSNERVESLVYRGPGGTPVRSSLAGGSYDMALFRLRLPHG